MFSLEHVSLRTGTGWRLQDLTLQISGPSTAIIGYSGAGKSSLLNLLAGYEHPDSGIIRRPTPAAPTNCHLPLFWVPQNGGLWPHLTAKQHLLAVQPGFPHTTRNSSISPDEILARLALSHRANARPSQLSLGESSRLAVARALIACADWLLMDEPLAHVDPVRKPDFWHAVEEIARAAGTHLVFSSHEPEFILRHALQAVCLHQGQLLWTGTVQELFKNPPSAELGRFLGPLNWWTPAEASALSTHCPATKSPPVPPETCLRPHQIQLQPHPAAGLTVLHTRCCGLYHETQLQARSGQTLSVLHTTNCPLSPGSTVTAGIQGAA